MRIREILGKPSHPLINLFYAVIQNLFFFCCADVRKFRVSESSGEGNLREGDPVSRKILQPSLRDQNPQERSYHQEG